ncbi:MAG: DUF3592 domain-containing protein [Hyphomicrobiaceae bacterium]
MLADDPAKLQRRNLTTGRGAAAALVGIAGVAIMLWAAVLAAGKIDAIWQSAKAAGQIEKLVNSGHDGRGVPIISFVDADGRRHTFMSQSAGSAERYRPGDEIVVLYDPADPAQAHVADYTSSFAQALLTGTVGALLVLISGLLRQSRTLSPQAGAIEGTAPTRKTSPPRVSGISDILSRRLAGDEPELQYHPFNAVAVKHYLAGLGRPASDRKVKLTESRQALAEGRVPVGLTEFLAYACALAYHEDAPRYLRTHCPRVGEPHLVTYEAGRALCFVFEGVTTIAVVDPDGFRPLSASAALLTPRAGARQYVPEESIWDAAPRARAAARMWNGLRPGVEEWLKGVLRTSENDDKPPILLAGHQRGGAAAMLAAYEFAKRGRNICGVVTFGTTHPGGKTFVSDYAQLGLDERTLHVVSQSFGRRSLHLGARLPGNVFRLARYRPSSEVAGTGAKPAQRRLAERWAAAALSIEDGSESADEGAIRRRMWLKLLAADPSARRAIMRGDIERRYALSLTALILERLTELYSAEKSAEPASAAYAALSEHLLDSRGVRPESAQEAFLTLKDLPPMYSAGAGINRDTKFASSST